MKLHYISYIQQCYPRESRLQIICFKKSFTTGIYYTNKEAHAVYYTVKKHDVHLRTRRKCGKREPQTSVSFISRVFSNVRSVLTQCDKRLRLLNSFLM